jgi:hypothetical protein
VRLPLRKKGGKEVYEFLAILNAKLSPDLNLPAFTITID